MRLVTTKSTVAALVGVGLVAAATAVLVSPASSAPAPVVGVGSPAVAATFSSAGMPDMYEVHSDHRVAFVSPVNGKRTDLGGYSVDGVAAVAGDGFPEMVLVHGHDGAVWFRTHTGDTFGPWTSLGGRIAGRPAVAEDGNTLVLTVLGTDGQMYERTRTLGGWSLHWKLVPSHFAGSFALAPRVGHGGFVVFGRGTNGVLYTSVRTTGTAGKWSTFRRVPTRPGLVLTEPAVDPVGGVLYVRGADSACWFYDLDDPAAGWRSLGGRFASGFAAVTRVDQSPVVLVFGRGLNNQLYIHISSTPGWQRYVFV